MRSQLNVPAQTIAAGATQFARQQLAPRGPSSVAVLGVFPAAVYLELGSGAVIGLLAADAIALPIGLVLPTSSAVRPLDRYHAVARIESGVLTFGDLRVTAGRARSSAVGFAGVPDPRQVRAARTVLAPLWGRTELRSMSVASVAEIGALVGRGPGLTPAGDDLLCGLLAGLAAFGNERSYARDAVLAALTQRPRATTSLSRQLLRLACEGHAIAEVGRFARALCGGYPRALEPAARALISVGHSSGVALAFGVLAASELGR